MSTGTPPPPIFDPVSCSNQTFHLSSLPVTSNPLQRPVGSEYLLKPPFLLVLPAATWLSKAWTVASARADGPLPVLLPLPTHLVLRRQAPAF